MGLRFVINQYLKMILQGIVFPCIYAFYKRQHVDGHLVVFADAHHDTLPFSMERMHDEMWKCGYEVVDCLADISEKSILGRAKYMMSFMKLYACARYVFLCDYFLPVASCQKRPETIVVQLWHSGGLLKKFGFDASEDIPSFYRLNPYHNYNLVTVSAPCCEPVLEKAMHLPRGVVRATGISRSDVYFDTDYVERCRNQFYQRYPEAQGKKIILWAPTFRGTPGSPFLPGLVEIMALEEQLGHEAWMVLIKAHPSIDCSAKVSNCDIPSEELLPITDLLLTDYSSILFDYLLFIKPFVLFVPDYEDYRDSRGFYIEYNSLPGRIAKNNDELVSAIRESFTHDGEDVLRKCREFHMGSCDGHSSRRIREYIEGMSTNNDTTFYS